MLFHEIKVSNLLSFGPDGVTLPLRPLNVLIGPNGSGKSNLIEVFGLLHAAPTDLATPVREGGGVRDWIWKGETGAHARVKAVVVYPGGTGPLWHLIDFTESSQRFKLDCEIIGTWHADSAESGGHICASEAGGYKVFVPGSGLRFIKAPDAPWDGSVISLLYDPETHPEISYLSEVYGRIRVYREWCFGRFNPTRHPQKADQPNDSLEPDCSNLGLVLNRLRRDLDVKRSILENLRQLYPGIDDYDVSVEGGTVQVFFQESGFAIPATRLSDGTLRYLCLLAILCDPKPPPLVCIEEPELGLHPDILPTIAKLLKDASERTQLIVTTHSDILVDEFSDEPESVVVCEKPEAQTIMKRLDASALKKWLEKYRLGQLWTKGELGGVRW